MAGFRSRINTGPRIQDICDWHQDLWAEASENHKFLQGCGDGSLSAAQFNTWLVQGALFDRSFGRFFRALISNTENVDDLALLNDGLEALEQVRKVCVSMSLCMYMSVNMSAVGR